MTDKINELLKNLIEIESTSKKPEKIHMALDFVKKEFGNKFYAKEYQYKDRPILVLSNTETRVVDLIIACHIDIVPADEAAFKLTEREGKLFGRGVFDMKGSLVASLFAAYDVFSSPDNKLSFAFFITADEEIDGLSTEYLLEKENYSGKFALVPDGGAETGIVIEEKGLLQIQVDITGKSAHASRPWLGNNSIDKAIEIYTKLLVDFPNPKNEQDWRTTVGLTKIQAGEAINQIPSKAVAFFDIRYVSEKDLEKVLEIIKQFGADTKYRILSEGPMLKTSDNNKFIDVLKDSIFKITNKKAFLIRESGTSDAVFFSQQNIPVVLIRPNGAGAHEDIEWIEKDSLERFYNILKMFFQKIQNF